MLSHLIYTLTLALLSCVLYGAASESFYMLSPPSPFAALTKMPDQRLYSHIRYQIAKEFEKYFEKLIDMLTRIGDVLPRCRVYQSLFSSHERLLQAISLAYLDIIYFCMDAKETFRKLKKSTTSRCLNFFPRFLN